MSWRKNIYCIKFFPLPTTKPNKSPKDTEIYPHFMKNTHLTPPKNPHMIPLSENPILAYREGMGILSTAVSLQSFKKYAINRFSNTR